MGCSGSKHDVVRAPAGSIEAGEASPGAVSTGGVVLQGAGALDESTERSGKLQAIDSTLEWLRDVLPGGRRSTLADGWGTFSKRTGSLASSANPADSHRSDRLHSIVGLIVRRGQSQSARAPTPQPAAPSGPLPPEAQPPPPPEPPPPPDGEYVWCARPAPVGEGRPSEEGAAGEWDQEEPSGFLEEPRSATT
jgi:hypothetical protein